jgi:hypothetical protein
MSTAHGRRNATPWPPVPRATKNESPWLELTEKWQRLAVQVANSPSSQQIEQLQRTQNSN